MKKISTSLIIFIVVAFILLPVPVSGQDPTNSTIIPNTTVSVADSSITTQIPIENSTTIPASSTMAVTVNSTPLPETTGTVNGTNMTTLIPTTVPVSHVSTGEVTVASSPLGASVLIDGAYYGTTPGNISGISGGNHIVRLTMSGYYDYEGNIYVVSDQVTHIFGTLQPLGGVVPAVSQQPTAVPVATTPGAAAQPTSSGGPFDNPTVLAATIGTITACIGAGATLFTHYSNLKKE